MFIPQTFFNVFFFPQQSETVKTKKCNRLLPKNCTVLNSTLIQGAEAAWQDQIHNGPLSQLICKTAMEIQIPGTGWPAFRSQYLHTAMLVHKPLSQPCPAHSARNAEHGQVQSTYPKVSSSAEGYRFSCTTEQQQGVAQLPQCLDWVASSYNMLVFYWEVCSSS